MQDKIGPNKKSPAKIIIVLSLAVFLTRLDAFIVAIAIPSIAENFSATSSEAAFVILSYMVFMTSSLLILGKFSDRTDMKKVLVWGYTVFMAASLSCALSNSLTMLVVSRSIQGIGAAMMSVAVYGLIPVIIPEDHIGRTYSVIVAAMSIGATLGLPVGGLITWGMSWRWIFFVNIPICGAAILFSLRMIPAVANSAEKTRPPFDYGSPVFSFLFLSFLIFVLNQGPELGWKSFWIVSSLLGAAVSLVSFAIALRRASDPLLNPGLLRNKGFVFGLLAIGIVFFFIGGNLFLMPFYLKYLLGMKIHSAGLLFSLYPAAGFFINMTAGKMTDTLGPTRTARLGAFTAVFGSLFFVVFIRDLQAAIVACYLITMGIANGILIPATNKMFVAFYPQEHKGSASAMWNLSINVSQVLGLSILEAVFSNFFPGGNFSGDISGQYVAASQSGFFTAYLVLLFMYVLNFVLVTRLCAAYRQR